MRLLIVLTDQKHEAMKKLICFLIGMLMMLSLSAMTSKSTSQIVDNKASPPEINTSSNHYSFEAMPVTATINEVSAPPFITWGYNNVMTKEKNATPTILGNNRIQRFLGPGDSLVSGRLAGQQFLSQDNDNYKNLLPCTGLKLFLGPGDSLLLGEIAELNNMRLFASDDNAINQPMEIGGHRIV